MTRISRAALGLAAVMLLMLAPTAKAAAGKMEITPSQTTLSGAGTINVDVKVSNTSSQTLMEDVFLVGPGVNYSLGTIQPGYGRTDTLSNFPISEEQLGVPVVLSLRWKENDVGQTLDGSFTVSRKSSNPKLAFTRSADKTVAATGSVVKFTYTLQNQGDVDLTNISIVDPVTSQPIAAGVSLPVGSSAYKVTQDVTMPEGELTSTPVASYTANGAKAEQRLDPLVVALGVVKAEITAKITAKEASGTRISIDIVNSGTVDLKSAKLTDEQNAMVKNSFTLKAGETVTVEQTIIAQTKRSVVYTLNATDAMGNAFKAASKSLSVVPYIEAETVSLSMNVKLDESAPKIAGKTAVAVTLSNPSSVVLQDLVISEETLGELETLPYLDTGERTLTLQVDSVVSGQWLFSVAAADMAGNSYSAQAQPLAATPSATQPEETPQQPGASASPEVNEALETPSPIEDAAKDASSTLLTIMIVIIVLIILAVAALLLLRMQEKKHRSEPGGIDELEALLEKPVRRTRPVQPIAEEPLAQPVAPPRNEPRIEPRKAVPTQAPRARPAEPRVEPRKAPAMQVRPAAKTRPEPIVQKPAYEPPTPTPAPAPRESTYEPRKVVRQVDPFLEQDDDIPPMPAGRAPGAAAWQPPVRPGAQTRDFGPKPYTPFAQRPDHRSGMGDDDDISDTSIAYTPPYTPPAQTGPQREETLFEAKHADVKAYPAAKAPPTDEEEYERGRWDGMNNQPYTSGGDSPAYDRGYLQGCKERSMR